MVELAQHQKICSLRRTEQIRRNAQKHIMLVSRIHANTTSSKDRVNSLGTLEEKSNIEALSQIKREMWDQGNTCTSTQGSSVYKDKLSRVKEPIEVSRAAEWKGDERPGEGAPGVGAVG